MKKTIETVTAPLPLPKGTLITSIKKISIFADPLLEKVFYNLVENALRHGKGVSWITFSTVIQGDNIIIVCEDNGDGIPEEYKEVIFNSQHFENTGFGLFLSREILGITSLSIRETGEPGKGGRFEITVPPGYFRVEGQVVCTKIFNRYICSHLFLKNSISLIRFSTNSVIPMVNEREKKVILLVACLASFLVPYTGSSITVALPAIATQFNADVVTLGWITSAYIVSAALFIVPFGRLADILGRKKIFVLGVLIFTVASFASALATAA